MSNPLSRWFRHRALSGAAAVVVAAVAAPAAAAPQDPGGRACAGFSAAAAGDLVTLRLLDLSPLGSGLPPAVDLTLASSRAGFAGSAGQAAAQGRYAQGRVLGFAPPLGPLDAAAYRIAPPTAEPTTVDPGRIALGPLRAGSGSLTARSEYGAPGRCDHTAGVTAESTAALADAAVLPGRRALLSAADNLTTGTRAALVRHRGGTGAEAVSSGGLTDLALFEALHVRVFNPVSLRVVASGTAATSVVDYRSPIIGIDLPDGREVKLDQANRSFDIAIPGPGTQPVADMPMLPDNTLSELLNALPGGAAAVPESLRGGGNGAGVPESAGSPTAPSVPGLPETAGVPAVGGLLGGAGRIAATPTHTSLVLRLTGGELTKEITDSGVHAKAISLRVKLLVLRPEGTTTLIDLALGVLEAAATAPPAAPVEGRDRGDADSRPGRGHDGYGGEGPDGYDGGEGPDAPPSASPSTPAPPAAQPPGGGGRLPVTGTALSAAVGAGVVLLLAGRFLLILTRRRTAPPPA